MKLLRKKLRYAIKAFQEHPNIEFEKKRNLIADIVQGEGLTTYYQSIVELMDNEVIGYEALNHPLENNFFFSTNDMFHFAEQNKLIYDLDLKCRELAISRIPKNLNNKMIFVNVNSNVLMATFFSEDPFKRFLMSQNVNTTNIVLEITERQAIKDFNFFNKVLDSYRNEGFKIAVDDLGSGYSNLQTITEIRPDYYKLDMSLIRDIDKIGIKKVLVETLVNLSEKVNAKIIAEGIETEEEFNMLKALGVPYGQGFFIHRPKISDEIAC